MVLFPAPLGPNSPRTSPEETAVTFNPKWSFLVVWNSNRATLCTLKDANRLKYLCEHRKRCSLWPLSSSCSERNLLFGPCAASSGYSQPPLVSKWARHSEEKQNEHVFSLFSWYYEYIFLKILTHLFTGLAGEGLLHSGLLHLNILILVQPFFWVPLHFRLWLGWDPVKV